MSCFLGIDLGGTHLRAALVTPGGEVLDRAKEGVRSRDNSEGVLDQIVEIIQRFQAFVSGHRELRTVGIGAPGFLYRERGVIAASPHFPQWRDFPLRELLDAGLLVAGGSDSNVLPADVMLGIHAAANHPNEGERISAEEALRLYTENAARSEFEEEDRGTLAPGKSGDMIVVDDDPCGVRPDRIKDIGVVMTVVEGRVVYQKSK